MPDHRVHMTFFVRGPFHNQTSTNDEVWVCWFQELDLTTQVGPRRCFGSQAKVRELVRRSVTALSAKAAFDFDQALKLGRGSVEITLNEAQYRRLKGYDQERRVEPIHNS